MLRYYASRELSQRLQIPLNRWKRWAREFLPPDPLGGLQSGYARQFSVREAFVVYLGGFLVSGLGFAMPQARQIIKDLNVWMKRNVFETHLFGRRGGAAVGANNHVRYEIQILVQVAAAGRAGGKLAYRIRKIGSPRRVADGHPPQWTESYTETILKNLPDLQEGGYPPVRCLLDITALTDRFASLLKL
jgi:hypothetical protein